MSSNRANPKRAIQCGERDSAVDQGLDGLAALRRTLMQLALNEKNTAMLVENAVRAVSRGLQCPCYFYLSQPPEIQQQVSTCLPVTSVEGELGWLVVGEEGSPHPEVESSALAEIADLVGVCVVLARQNKAIAELHDESADMLHYAPDAIFVVEASGAVILANRRALEFVDAAEEEVTGQPIGRVLGSAMLYVEELRARAQTGEKMEVEISGPRGTKLAAINVSEVGSAEDSQLLCVVRDVTNECQAQLALRRTERSALLGQLVDYVLHEVNNPLGALMSSSELSLKLCGDLARLLFIGDDDGVEIETPSSGMIHQLESLIKNGHNAGARLGKAMQTLRAAHHRTAQDGPHWIEAGFEVGLAIDAIIKEFGPDAPVDNQVGTLPRLNAPSLLLAEALCALIRNAIQSVAAVPEGRVIVRAETTPEEVCITVEDNGPGIPEAIKKYVFMPFFTTKPLNNALGLGLTIAEDLVRRIGGRITLDRSDDRATGFAVTLPRHGKT